MNYQKKLRLLHALAVNRLRPSVPFLRIIPTDFCNLRCSYCWQHNRDRHAMTYEEFDACLRNGLALDVGLISFLGGEPTLWPHLTQAIAACSAHGVCTDITTNGSTLTPDSIAELAECGLDLLNISVDGLEKTKTSQKVCLSRPELLAALRHASATRGMRARINAVICKDNWPFIQDLIRLTDEESLPISLGFAMYRSAEEFDPKIHFGVDDAAFVSEIAGFLREAKRRGSSIIDPLSYFEGYPRFLQGERFWRCNYATRRGWINVDPYGFIRDCTKKLTRLPYPFATLSRADLRQVRQSLAAGVEQCNRSCYSNCAFDGAYYAKHKLQLLKSRIP